MRKRPTEFVAAILLVVLLSVGTFADARPGGRLRSYGFHASETNATVSNNSAGTNGTTCTATDLYAAAASGCGARIQCPITCFPVTCACLATYMSCIEARALEFDVRTTCSAASVVYAELLSVAAGAAYANTSLGESCRSAACARNVSCACAATAFVVTAAPTRAPATPQPAVTPPTSNGSSPAPAPTNQTTDSPRILVTTVVLASSLSDFNVWKFVAALAAAMEIAEDQVIIVSVASGSVIVKLYFAAAAGQSQQQLTDRFVSQVAIGSNAFTAAFAVVSVSTAFEDVSSATPLPPTPTTTAAPSNATPTERPEELESLAIVTVIIIVVVVGVVVLSGIAVVGCCCFWRWRRNRLIDNEMKRVEPIGQATYPHYKPSAAI